MKRMKVYTGWCVSGGYKPITRAPKSLKFLVSTEPRQTADLEGKGMTLWKKEETQTADTADGEQR